ncbi:MAG: phytanoyl-CoA dioxygenase family protein [Chryseolinea sp.]
MERQLTKDQIIAFERDGFVRLDNAFSKEIVDACVDILWNDLDVDRYDSKTWLKPVIRLLNYPHEPFRLAANTPMLHHAFDQLAGKGRWTPLGSLGTFPVRFPSELDPGDTGWHTDGSFRDDDGPWRLNIRSRERALLMLFLFSDICKEDAPTRILVGSHLDMPRLLAPHGDKGLNFIELAQRFETTTLERSIELATGNAGTVYLCHPFLVHGAQPHRGTHPRFLAQPPLLGEIDPFSDGRIFSPVERAIRAGLALS